MRLRENGSVQAGDVPTAQNVKFYKDYSLYRCMVIDVIYTDSSRNITQNSQSKRVMYDVIVLGGNSSGQILYNCRLASTLGGNNNYYERTLRAASSDITNTRLIKNNGDVVYVQFIQGDPRFPVIVALDEGIDTGDSTGAVSADGHIEKSQYNGIERIIDKNGNLTWTRKGGEFDEDLQAFVPTEMEDVKAQVEPQKVTLTLQNGLTVTIDGNTDQVDIKTQGGAQVTVDGTSDKVSALTAGQAVVEVDGAGDKVLVASSSGAQMEVDGTGDQAELKSNGSGKFKANADTIALGASGIEILEQISQQLSELSTFLNAAAAHTHVGNLGFPTAPPTQASDYTSAATALDAIKADVDSIKGSL